MPRVSINVRGWAIRGGTAAASLSAVVLLAVSTSQSTHVAVPVAEPIPGPAVAVVLPDKPTEPTGKPIFAEEFSGPAGTAPNPKVWDREGEIGNDLEGNSGVKALHYNTPGAENTKLTGDGRLALEIKANTDPKYQCKFLPNGGGPGTCAYTSALIKTEKSKIIQPYGRIEAKIQLPGGQGLLPAFWAMGANEEPWPYRGEIDIVESNATDGCLICSTVHGPDLNFAPGDFKAWRSAPASPVFAKNVEKFGDLNTMAELSTKPHVYAADWYPDRIEFSIDGRIHHTVRKSDAPAGSWVFDRPIYLIISAGVGGSGEFVGDPPAETTFPRTMYVDYVRVYATQGRQAAVAEPSESATAQPAPTQTAQPLGSITNPNSGGLCIDAVGGSTANETRLQLLGCKGNPAQQFTFGPGQRIGNGGKCLDVHFSGTTNGTPVKLYDCNGTVAQKWIKDSNNRLVNPNSGKCLHPIGGSRSAGTQLEIFDCLQGATSQVWTF